MQSAIAIITPAATISLVNVNEAKLALNLSRSVDVTANDQVALFVEWASSQVAVMANRVFASEKVMQTFREVDGDYTSRLFLSRWPVTAIDSVEEDGTVLAVDEYELDAASGMLTRIDTTWTGPVSVTYTGGYSLPNGAPPALKQAALLLTREAYQAAIRGDATIRMVAHKESRIIYFDPNAKGGGVAGTQPGAVGSASMRAVNDLLNHFRRIPA